MMKETARTEQTKKPFHKRQRMKEEHLCPVIEQLAVSCAKQFHDIATDTGKESATETILQMEHVQERNSSREAVALMKQIFDTAGKTDAAKALNFLDTCAQENDFVYEMFMDAFLGVDEVDWFLMEKLLTDAEYADDKKLN